MTQRAFSCDIHSGSYCRFSEVEVNVDRLYINVHGGVVAAKVIDVNHRRSPLVQGGLEIPVEVRIVMELEHTDQNE